MKKLFTILAAILIVATVWAQSPERMSYQAVIRNSSDALVTNTQVGMQISILQGSASGTAVYTETQTPTTNANGLVSIEIGAGTVVSGDFTIIDWANGPYFIKTETDPAGGTSYSITGTSQLLSVPYALHAKAAETITGTITETDPVFTAWDKTSGISITESQISDLGSYLETETDPLFIVWDKDYNDLTNTPPIPTVPENVSEFTNDAGYLTEYTETQTLSDVIANNNSANGQVKNVSDPTDAQDAATKAYVDLQIEELQIAVGLKIKDIEGNTYHIETIGTQVWMAENLKTTKYNDGTDIPLVTDNAAWESLSTPAYCWYSNDIANKSSYGAMYNWHTVNTGNLCPTGWHVPTDAEWITLIGYVGGTSLAGTKLKATSGWNNNGNGTDDYGFSALPSGFRDPNGTFYDLGGGVYWWSSTEHDATYAWFWYMISISDNIMHFGGRKEHGCSVRCVRD